MSHTMCTVMDYQHRKLLSIWKVYGLRKIKQVIKTTKHRELCCDLDVKFSLRRYCPTDPLLRKLNNQYKMSSKLPSSPLRLNKKPATH